MKMETVGDSAPNPEISLIQKDTGTKPGRFPGHQEKVSRLKIPANLSILSKAEYDDLLIEARHGILDDGNLLSKMLLAVKEKANHGSIRKFAEVENILVEKCVNLTDIEIDRAIEQLGRKFLDYLSNNRTEIQSMGNKTEEATTGKFNIDSRGIKSVVNFVRERSKLLMSNPSQPFVIGFNNNLDAKNGIDLLEVILGDGSDIDQLNLIQIKSSVPTTEETDHILKEHKDYVEKDLMSLKNIEDLELPEEKEKQLFEETLSNQAAMIEKVFEICADYKKGDLNTLAETLGLTNLNNIQKAWVLETYFEVIKEQIELACTEGYIEAKNRDDLIEDLGLLRQSLIKKSGIPTNVVRIKSVNSIIAIGPKVIKQTEIYNSKGSGRELAATM